MKDKRTNGIFVAFCLIISLGMIFPQWAKATPDYDAMVDQIDAFFSEALDAYKKGDAATAKLKAQSAYFEVFENLEGPIRINVSAKKNFLLEEEFVGVRKMIVAGEPYEAIDKRVKDLMVELREVIKELKGGYVLKAEGTETHSPAPVEKVQKEIPARDWQEVSNNLFANIEKAIALYEKGDPNMARSMVQDTYFDIFEASGMEAKIGARDAAFKAKLESRFTMIASQMKMGAPATDIHRTLRIMKEDFGNAVAMLGSGSESPWTLFIYSLLIILREGFEAILIVTAIIAFLVKTGHPDKLKVIYNGVIVALILSVVTAILVKWVFQTSAASQEVLEGVTMLLASLVLFSVSYWLISKIESKKWMTYIQGKMSSSLSSGSLKALWFVVFLAVYREGAETVLFYQALVGGQSSSGVTVIAVGFGVGCILLIGLYVGMRHGVLKLPIGPFFMATGAILYYMAFVFAGKGVMELIEGKVIEPSLITWVPTVPLLGLYPYWETLLPQLALVIAAIIGLVVVMRQKSGAAEKAV